MLQFGLRMAESGPGFFELGAVLDETPCEDGSVEMHLRIQESSLRKITQDELVAQSVP